MNSKVLEELVVVKRSGQRVNFNGTKVVLAIKNAFDSLDSLFTENDINIVYEDVLKYININYNGRKTINVEDIQDIIEDKLKENDYIDVYSAFNSYRLRRAASREVFSIKQQHKFVKAVEKLGLQSKNIYDQPLNIMTDFGKTISREFTMAYLLENKYVRAHDEGIIHIHNLNYYPLSTTSSTHLDFNLISKEHIYSYLDRILSIISKIKNEQTGEHSIDNINILMSDVALNTFKSIYKNNLKKYLNLNGFLEYLNIKTINITIDKLDTINYDKQIFSDYYTNTNLKNIFDIAYNDSILELKNIIHLSIKQFLIDLSDIDSNINNNKISISIGYCDKMESKLVEEIYLEVLDELGSLNNIITIYKISNDIVPSIIYKLIKEYKNIDLSFNHISEYFSTGEKIYSNINDDVLTSEGRMILSTTSINLGRLGLKNKNKPIKEFYEELNNILELVKNQLIQRFELQANKYPDNFPNLFKYNLLFDSNKLEKGQKIRKVLKNGVLNIGLSGLKECVGFLNKSDEQNLLLDILKFINNKAIQYTNEFKLNFIVSETTNKEVLKTFLTIDKSIYGIDSFDKDKNTYSTVGNIKDNNYIYPYGKIQELLNTKIIIFIKNNNDKNIMEIIEKMKALNVMYFRIEVNKT